MNEMVEAQRKNNRSVPACHIIFQFLKISHCNFNPIFSNILDLHTQTFYALFKASLCRCGQNVLHVSEKKS